MSPRRKSPQIGSVWAQCGHTRRTLAIASCELYLDRVYETVAIRSFRRREAADFFFDGRRPRREGWGRVAGIVMRKLDMLHYAHMLGDLRSPPSNRLEALRGDLAGLHSIRVNDQWRVVFRWTVDGPEDVDVVDYHR